MRSLSRTRNNIWELNSEFTIFKVEILYRTGKNENFWTSET